MNEFFALLLISLAMASLLIFTLLILASVTALNADRCIKKQANPPPLGILAVGNFLQSLPEGNEVQAGFEMVRDFFKTSPFPLVGYLDPLYIEAYRIELDDDDMTGYADIAATTIKGLLGFEVTDIKVSLNTEKFQLDFLFPEISASGKYDMPPTQLFQEEQTEIYGNGEFVLTARDVHVQINADVGKTIDGEMFVEKMESELCFEAVDAKVTGLYDDELASEDASLKLSEYLPDYLPLMKDAVDEFLVTYTEYVNNKLALKKYLKNTV